MAEYTGVDYDPNFFRGEDEGLADYFKRLSDSRDGGVLGTGSKPVLATPEVTEEPLAEVQMNCPAGFTWNGTGCVPVSSGGGNADDEAVEANKASLEAMVRQASGASFDPADIISAFLPNPLLSMGVKGLIDSSRNASIAEKLAETGKYTKEDIDFMIDNPEVMAAELYNNADLGFKQGLDIEDVRPSGLSNFLGGLFGSDSAKPWESSNVPQALQQAVARLNPASNFMGFNPDGSMVANINGTPMSYTYGMLGNTAATSTAPTVFNPAAIASSAGPSVVATMFGLNPQEQALSNSLATGADRAANMATTISNLNSGATSSGDSGYFSDSSGSYTGGADYGGWTGVNEAGDGNDWDSFGGW